MSHNLPVLACLLISLSCFLPTSPIFPRPLFAQTTDNAQTDYDRYMQEGYEATEQREYQTALQKFQQALAERPNDFYAQQAIENVERYLARPSPEASGSENWLILALALGGSAVLLSWFFYQRTYRSNREAESHIPAATIYQPEPMAARDVEPDISPAIHNAASSHPSPPEPAAVSTQRYRSQPHSTPEPKATPTQRYRSQPYSTSSDLDDLIQELQADSRKRRRAIWELTQRGDSRAVEPLVERLVHSDSHERSLILEALTRISARTLQPMNQALTVSLEDDSPQVRKNAIREMTQVYELMSHVNELLSLTVDDPDVEVQETAQWALTQIRINHLLNADVG